MYSLGKQVDVNSFCSPVSVVSEYIWQYQMYSLGKQVDVSIFAALSLLHCVWKNIAGLTLNVPARPMNMEMCGITPVSQDIHTDGCMQVAEAGIDLSKVVIF